MVLVAAPSSQSYRSRDILILNNLSRKRLNPALHQFQQSPGKTSYYHTIH